jgi:phenylacetate-coenzyme A ligase PaaK-like adenylate-forming protein
MSKSKALPVNFLTRDLLQKMIIDFRDVLLARERLSPSDVRAYQNVLLARLLEHAIARVPYYSKRLAPFFSGERFLMERWLEIPLLTRSNVQSDAQMLYSQKLPFYFGTVDERTTSGSTGRPIDCREDSITRDGADGFGLDNYATESFTRRQS